VIPPTALPSSTGVVRVRYGFVARNSTDEEKIVGDFNVVSEDHEAMSWTAPKTTLEELAPVVAGSEVKLTALIEKTQEETIKPIWFVSSGKLKNYQSRETTWTEFASGPQSVILAVFPNKSKFFSIHPVAVTVP
jgi:hypothetical protein